LTINTSNGSSRSIRMVAAGRIGTGGLSVMARA
jgi:hypothetical protein